MAEMQVLLPFTTEASVSPWDGDPTGILTHFMPAKDILSMMIAPSLSQIASPREGLTMAGPLRGCSPARCSTPLSGNGLTTDFRPLMTATLTVAIINTPCTDPRPHGQAHAQNRSVARRLKDRPGSRSGVTVANS
ncbi:hypothetical protein FIU89_05385 [Roseovarius sp. THAF27]|nr:hypothetical protein FIU89_05385 [Roseovarius sp. THAF27]